MRGAILLSFWALGLAACGAEPELSTGTRPDPPRGVVLILADDLGYGDLGCYGEGSRIPTPRIDAVASAGTRFTDAHSPSAVCSPTRYGLLTGRYAWRTRLQRGVLWGESRLLPDPQRTTLADLYREAGYVTACIGKWHLGLGEREPVDYRAPLRPGPLELGFDTFFGIAGALDMGPYVYLRDAGVVQPPSAWTGSEIPARYGGPGFWREGAVSADFRHDEVLDRVTDEGIAFLRERAKEGSRFFLYLSLTAPHTPWLPGEAYRGRSEAGVYGDFVAHIDACVGRVDDALNELDLARSTLLLFTSDNGSHWTAEDVARFEHHANGRSRGQKGDIWEGGHRVPLIARWPGVVPESSTRDRLVDLVDLFATSASLLGRPLRPGEGEDSFDASDALWGGPRIGPERVGAVHHSFDGHFAIRQGRHKLLVQHGSGGFTEPAQREPAPGEPPGALYDLEADPAETTNLWSDEPELVQELAARLLEAQRSGRTRP